MSTDMDTFIRRQRTDILRQLVELANDKTVARKLVADLMDADAMRDYRAETTRAKYAGYKKTRDAMKALFDEEQWALSEDDIKQEICDGGGFRRGAGGLAGARMAVQKSIKLHLHGDGAKKWPLKMINGLIGPKDWPDERFEPRK